MNNAKPQHAPTPYFTCQGSDLLAGNQPIKTLAEIVGQTPFYVYDRQVIRAKIDEFRRHIPPRIRLHYAIKANPHQAVVDCIARQVDGLDIASQKELLVALNSGMAPANISFAGPAKSMTDIGGAIAAGITLNIESETELERARDWACRHARVARVALRVNPDFELKSSGMKMAGGPKPFGIDAERIPAIIRCMNDEHLDFQGLHIFSGIQNLNESALMEAHDKTFALARWLALEGGKPIRKLNIGGGFGIPYFPGEKRLDLGTIGENLATLCQTHADLFADTEIIIELGRYLVGEAGLYITRITDIKQSREQLYWMVDGGLHHHLANSGNFGQVIRRNYPVCVANRMDELALQPVTIVGPLCTPLDVVADKFNLPHGEIGDFIAIYQSGAYGATASPRGFLSQPDLVEILV